MALATSEPVLLVVSAKSNIKTVADLVREAKANPEKISYGSSGVGTIHHITAEVFKSGVGIDMQHIPYKGSGQSVPAILAGDVPVLMSGYGSVAPHIRSGALNLLAVTTASRIGPFPATPAMGEFIKGYDFPSETGILAPAGLPAPIVTKLAVAIKQAIESPEFLNRFKETSIVANFKNSADYTENLKANLKKYESAVSIAKIQPE